jgi:hypothetical protein
VAGGDVRGKCNRPDTNRVAVLESVIDARGRVAEDPDPDEGPQRKDEVGIITAGGEGVGARVAGPQLGTRRLLSTVSPPPWSGCGSEFRSTLTSLMLKPSFAMLAMIIGAVLG